MNKKRKPFEESLFNAMYDCFRAAGVNPNVDQIDKLRSSTLRLAKLIETESKVTSLTLVERLQNRISEAFDKLQDRIDQLTKQIASKSIDKK